MMISLTQAAGFLLAAMLLTASPGPDNLMVLSIGMARGRRPGIAFGLGCAFGCLFHTLLAVIGVSALVAASPVAFLMLKWAGGGYLIRLGWLAVRHAGAVRVGGAAPADAASAGAGGAAATVADADAADSGAITAGKRLRILFGRGLLANAVNPKVVLFFLSFLPQFVLPAQGHVPLQLAQFGVLFTAQAAVLFTLIGFFSGSLGQLLNRTPAAGRWLDRLAGLVFLGLGVRMIVMH